MPCMCSVYVLLPQGTNFNRIFHENCASFEILSMNRSVSAFNEESLGTVRSVNFYVFEAWR